ncbi:hypothetical protein DV711_06990 [Motiliproteus coralliicola]|uniref:Rhodanese domain-containing protein n=1 Tax=Motiliproteus coralliicola TaxID=2283196 RepID=A0A369WJX7_9GAMM|nr:hypothetical protein [Motiliproteus coralliicola]RDE22348.1 hypothetical protein DV711_06990 [Motiliproteus coralliicola]
MEWKMKSSTCAWSGKRSWYFQRLLLLGWLSVGLDSVSVAEERPLPLSCDSSFDLSFTPKDAANCILPVSQVNTRLERYRIVDVRDLSPDQSKLSGVLAIPNRQLIHKQFLKDDDLLLIDSSFGSVSSIQWCHRLKQAGFKSVGYLQGGVRAYRTQLQTRSIAVASDNAVSSSAFWSEWNNGRVRVVGLGSEAQDKLEQLGVVLDLRFSEDELQGVVELTTLLEENQTGEFTPIVLISDDIADAKRLADSFQQLNLFYLEDGVAGLKTFVERQRVITSQRNRSSNRRMMCNV